MLRLDGDGFDARPDRRPRRRRRRRRGVRRAPTTAGSAARAGRRATAPTRSPAALRHWPVPFRHPLTAIAAEPGKAVGAIDAQALAVGDQGEVARYAPGQGWSPEPLLGATGRRATPRLRGVAWPDRRPRLRRRRQRPRCGCGARPPASGSPTPPSRRASALANFTGIAFDPGQPRPRLRDRQAGRAAALRPPVDAGAAARRPRRRELHLDRVRRPARRSSPTRRPSARRRRTRATAAASSSTTARAGARTTTLGRRAAASRPTAGDSSGVEATPGARRRAARRQRGRRHARRRTSPSATAPAAPGTPRTLDRGRLPVGAGRVPRGRRRSGRSLSIDIADVPAGARAPRSTSTRSSTRRPPARRRSSPTPTRSPGDGYVLRQTARGWHDEQHQYSSPGRRRRPATSTCPEQPGRRCSRS